jgi:3-methyladenine DNA glycosylase/8-oxoguanine DNA glycosylase
MAPKDPILGVAIKKIGACGMAGRQRADHLNALVGAIVSQQLSTKAAATIFGRFVALFPDGEIYRERVGFLTKSIIAWRAI